MSNFTMKKFSIIMLIVVIATFTFGCSKEIGNPTSPEIASETDELSVGAFSQAAGSMLKTPTGFYYPAERSDTGGLLGWLRYNSRYPSKPYHLGVDFSKNRGETVRAISDGTVVYSSMNAGGYGCSGTPGGAMVVQHKTSSGTVFTAVYGHVQNILPLNAKVAAGAKIAEIGPCYKNVTHLHFGIHLGTAITLTGYSISSSEAAANKAGWYNPLKFIEMNQPMNGTPPTPVNPQITSVSPNPFPRALNWEKRVITISGKDFKSGAKLEFKISGTSYVYPDRVPTFVNSNTLTYNISVGPNVYTWTVQVINPDGRRSNLYTFYVK